MCFDKDLAINNAINNFYDIFNSLCLGFFFFFPPHDPRIDALFFHHITSIGNMGCMKCNRMFNFQKYYNVLNN